MDFDTAFDTLVKTCVQADLRVDQTWRTPLRTLAQVLAETNARTNLVGNATPAGLCEHVIEALTLAAVTETGLGRAPRTVVDVGAGAGLEALTLALCWPQARVVAVEPRALRQAFVRTAATAMGLTHLEVVGKSLHGAALGPTFDLAVARAVWPPPEWLPRARMLLNPQGLVGVHGLGPADALAASLPAVAWRTLAARDVPGPRHHAVAVLRAC
jgi:16S rRNA G527 N7-methylase RsmG